MLSKRKITETTTKVTEEEYTEPPPVDEDLHYFPGDGMPENEAPHVEYYFYHSNAVKVHADFARDSAWEADVFVY